MSNKELIDKLEQMIDQNGIEQVLDTIQTVCYQKAEHLRHNWQDDKAAKVWESVYTSLNGATALAAQLEEV